MASFHRICLGLVVFATVRAALAEDVRVDVVVDMTDAGKTHARPTPDRPTYYMPVVAGYQAMGAIVVHYQDRPPPQQAEVEQQFTQALAAQGYLPATKRSPPSIIIVYSWGYIAPQIVGKGRLRMIANETQTLAMVAGNTTDVQVMAHMPPWMQEVFDSERRPRYYLVVAAFDYKAYQTHQTVLLWRAHISVPLWGHYLDQMLPTLITAAAPALGIATTRPQFGTIPFVPPGSVFVGAPYVRSEPGTPAPKN